MYAAITHMASLDVPSTVRLPCGQVLWAGPLSCSIAANVSND